MKTLTDQRGGLRAVRHVVSVAVCFGQMRQVGVDIPSEDAGRRAVAERQTRRVGLAEDADEVVDPLVVSLSGQQGHDHQLDAQKHEQVAPLGLQRDHGGRSVWSTLQLSDDCRV